MKSPQDFAESFGLPQGGFTAPSLFADGFGFSTLKDRAAINSRPFASLYKFYITDEELNSGDNLKNIKISASYGEKIPEGISLTPNGIKRRLNWPRDIFIDREYFYNILNGEFTHKTKAISASEVLRKVEDAHTLPTKSVVGLPFLLQQLFNAGILGILNLLYLVERFALWTVSGAQAERNIFSLSSSFKNEIEMPPFAKREIDIFGYKASAWSVVVYSATHAAAYIFWYFFFRDADVSFLTTPFQSAFLTASYVIPTLVFFERILPKLIRSSMEYTSKAYIYVAFH